MQLQAFVDDLALKIGDPVFRHRGGRRIEFVFQQKLGAMVSEDLGDGRFSLAFGQLELRILEVPDRATERLALFYISDGFGNRTLDHADALKTDDMTLLRQLCHQLDKALTLFSAEQIGGRHADIIEEELGRVSSLLADLAEVTAALEALDLVCLDADQ